MLPEQAYVARSPRPGVHHAAVLTASFFSGSIESIFATGLCRIRFVARPTKQLSQIGKILRGLHSSSGLGWGSQRIGATTWSGTGVRQSR